MCVYVLGCRVEEGMQPLEDTTQEGCIIGESERGVGIERVDSSLML